MWQSPSRSATSPPREPTALEASVSPGSRARSTEAARSSTGSCEPMATTVRSPAPSSRSNCTSTASPAWWPSSAAGTTSRPSARTSEVSTPAPRGSGVATSAPPTRPSRTRTYSSAPAAPPRAAPPPPPPPPPPRGGGDPAREPRRRPRALGGGGALEPGQQREGEDVERQRGGDRIAGATQHRPPRHRAQHDRMARLDRHAVHAQGSRGGHDGGRVVVAAGARPGDHDHEVGFAGGRLDGG